jgi:hypothetical protein
VPLLGPVRSAEVDATEVLVMPTVELTVAPVVPGLELGAGDRRDDCRNYPECLDSFTRQHCQRRNPNGRCPSSCPTFEPIPLQSRIESASVRKASEAI